MSSAMGPVAHAAPPGTTLVVLAVSLLALVALVAAPAAMAVRGRRAARDRAARDAAKDEELRRSRQELEALSRKVDELSEVTRTARAGEVDREYVITSLGQQEQLPGPVTPGHPPLPVRQASPRPLAAGVEDRLVEALAQAPRTSAVQVRGVELAVRVLSLAHGVRRALSADVLDRAAAEAQVARRRSRRDRRRELREARRVLAADRQRRDVA